MKPDDHIKTSAITPAKTYFSRRNFMRAATLAGTATATGLLYRTLLAPTPNVNLQDTQIILANSKTLDGESLTPFQDITSYNNYYEFSTDKYAVARRARNFKTEAWTIRVDGLVQRPRTYAIEDLKRLQAPEERIYRFRCVEGWSMVIPWLGLPLNALLKDVEPLGTATHVAFETYYDPKQMPDAEASGLELPYVEGLRLDEALHPLTLLSTGLYGRELLPQNGAPVRLVVPWKYGYKSIKSLVRITLTDRQPPTTWNISAPREYGFYSNVNPDVAHPRWSQKSERRIGEFMRRETLMFNGYANQVASLYAGMNLRKEF